MLSHLVAEATQHAAGGLCPKAPTGVEPFVNDFQSWIQWGVLAIILMAAVAGAGMLVFGRVTGHPKGARLGLEVIMVVILGAVLYVIIPGIVTGITGKGCV